MKINEARILEYLENHVGENTTTHRLALDSKAVEGINDFQADMAEADSVIRRVTEENGFRLNDDHCRDQFLGMPWVFDFYIEKNRCQNGHGT